MKLAIGTTVLAAILTLSACGGSEPETAEAELTVVPATQTTAPVFSADWPQPYVPHVTDAFTQEGIDALEARMVQFVEDGDVQGIATLLVHDGQVISHVQAGIRREEDGAPIQEDTIYRIYSMTKPITGVALMTLYEEGAFSLDDPIIKFIPEFENLQVWSEDGSLAPVSRPATMRELMSHTAGFAYGFHDGTLPDAELQARDALNQPDMQSFIDVVAGVPLVMEPGTNWYYSLSVDIQGAIIERISGVPFETFLQTRIFDPLGMDETAFTVSEEDYDRFSDVFRVDADTGAQTAIKENWTAYRDDTVVFYSGGGGLVSTLDDYARFCQMLLGEGSFGDVQILKPETIKLMATNILTEEQANTSGLILEDMLAGVGFGLDFAVIAGPPATERFGLGSFYWAGAAGTWFWIDPENDLFFVGMVQRFNGQAQTEFREISAAMLQEALDDDL